MPKKPVVVETDPRLLAKGVVIWNPSSQSEEVVRDVIVVLQLASGESRSYGVGTDIVEVLKKQPDPVEAAKLMIAKETPEEAKQRILSEPKKAERAKKTAAKKEA